MQIKKKFSNINQATKIRNTGTGLVTTIPKTVVQLLEIQDGDKIIWDIDIQNNLINITLNQNDTED